MKRIAIAIQPPLKRIEAIFASNLLFSEPLIEELKKIHVRFALFCDENISKAFGKKWHEHLSQAGLDVSLFTFPTGEQEKNRERKAALEDAMLEQKMGKHVCAIALGGGVTTDLIGFLASTYCRGIPLIAVPTTLLSMVDAAVGGKTGVNTRFGKNLIGTFYPADVVLIDPSLLATLPPSEWTNGSAEVIKYALIRSPSLFQLLRQWNPKDPSYLEAIIFQSILIKAEIVERDFEERLGVRHILNFGHTIAHALEWLEEYKLSHGEAVAMGMLVESYISMKMGYLPAHAFVDIEALIRSFPFALHLTQKVTMDGMREALQLDKKAVNRQPRFVVLDAIGSCNPFHSAYCTHIQQEILDEALAWMFAQFTGGAS